MPLEATGQYSPILLDYLAGKESLRSFYGNKPHLAGIEQQIAKRRSFPLKQRKLLQNVLREQYKDLSLSTQAKAHLDALADANTFVITTGQQLNICTGPLYFPFKAITALSLAHFLKKAYPRYHFVPLFWMHSEDHDTEEINHLYLSGQGYEAPLKKGGPVGLISSATVAELLRSLPFCLPAFLEAYTQQSQLVGATRQLLHTLFGEMGLLTLDPMDARLKKSLIPVLKADLRGSISEAFREQTQALQSLGYPAQLSERASHFFYLREGHRGSLFEDQKEILAKSSPKETLHTKSLPQATKASLEKELLESIAQYPERLSPSAALRPLYQELILPSIAYVAGPSEIAYWMQLGRIFEEHKVPMPVLVPRFFGALIPATKARKCQKLRLHWKDLFLPSKTLHKKLLPVLEEYRFEKEKKQIDHLFKDIEAQLVRLDPSLRSYVHRQAEASLLPIERIEDKLRKRLLSRSKDLQESLHALQSTIKPGGIAQERRLNLMPFLVEAPDLLSELVHQVDPFDFRFHFVILGHE